MASPNGAGRSADGAGGGDPSILDLIRLSPSPVFPAGGEDIYRHIARTLELQPGCEVLVSGCGRGISTLFLAEAYGVEGAGVDPSPELIREADVRARGAGIEGRVHFQAAPLDSLPYLDEIFDVSLGEIGLANPADPARAIAELVRVTKPMGAVVLVQLTWTGNVDPVRRQLLAEHMGARPMLLVEWKQLLRDAGVVELLVEDWSDDQGSFRAGATPFPDFARLFSLRDKLSILRSAFERWGWRGVRGAVLREQEIHRLLSRERVLGLTLIRGTRWPHAEPASG